MNNQWFPTLCGSIAVWQDYRDSNVDIHWHDLLTRESQITTETDENPVRR